MNLISKGLKKWNEAKANTQLQNEKQRVVRSITSFVFSVFRWLLIIGISYVILGPLIGIVASSFFSDADKLNPVVYLIPQSPTLQKYALTITRMHYVEVLINMLIYVLSLTAIQIVVCSMVGYGFARYQFPFKKLLFAFVIVMIVIPTHTVMLPMYVTFRNFNPLWLVSLIFGAPVNLLSTPAPMFILTIFGCGLRSGLYIYIFNQFFRGLPKEIEEAAFVDGAGTIRTFARVMIPNAVPSIITVTIFSLVWQYNDLFYARLFNVSNDIILSKRLDTLQLTLTSTDKIRDPAITALYVYAGIVLMILPMLIIYIVLQRRFIEGVERSGIVG